MQTLLHLLDQVESSGAFAVACGNGTRQPADRTEIEIRKRALKFDGAIKKTQRHYEQQRQLYEAAQEIVGLL